MITITMPKWWAIAMAIWFAIDIIKILLILVTDALEKAEQREYRRQMKEIAKSAGFDWRDEE